MLPEQNDVILKHFVELVKDCDLERVMQTLSIKEPTVTKLVLDSVKFEEDRRHNNRCILFTLLKIQSPTVFSNLAECLREHKREELADKLENKPTARKHVTSCAKPPESLFTLKISIKCATKFLDIKDDCYRTRSKNRGRVLLINNIIFDGFQTRIGAEVDEYNVKELFEKIGFGVESYRNLSAQDVMRVIEKFAMKEYEMNPDIGIVIIMSHGLKVNNETVVVCSDGQSVHENWIIKQFNNQTCVLFRNRPKLLIFNICRGDQVDKSNLFPQRTQSDSACIKEPEIVDDGERYYSDLMICHPTVEGFIAHRDVVRGTWYIELLCKVFMENSHHMDVESMLKRIERGLASRTSENMTRQTSTFLNIAFKTLYLHPGIYEDNGQIVPFKPSE